MPDLTAPAPNWAAIGSLLVGLAGFVLALHSWRRAGRSAELAERAERRAIDAESRAEEAHTLFKERSATEKERAQAELDAPPIADRWRSQMAIAAQEAQRRNRPGQTYYGHVSLTVNTLAEHLALRTIRSERDALGIIELIQNGETASVTLMTPYQLNQKRARGR
ncbi:MAG TPA: hypothetical protein VHP33_28615 [Polyangiaceae bacterium]|nr:hypothetical protein [Polyangiaceae bacterium]